MAKEVDYNQLKTSTVQQVQFLNEKATLSETDVYVVVKEFFKQLFSLDYEFSHEELLEEIDKTYIEEDTKNTLMDFIRMIGRIEYDSDTHFNNDELKGMLSTFNDVVERLIKESINQQKKGKIINKTEDKTLGQELDDIKKESDINIAKEKYKKALEKYNLMTQAEQELYYKKLQEVYEFLKFKA
jgi:hypothetical protein